MTKYVEVDIKKPLYGSFCYVADKYIQIAKRFNLPLKITCPKGVGIFTADEWLKDAKMMKKVFLRPDEPMILWGNRVIKEKNNNQAKLFNP